MHFKEELDISTIWWLFETKVWLQLLQAAELEHIVLDKLFSLFSSWILNYKWKLQLHITIFNAAAARKNIIVVVFLGVFSRPSSFSTRITFPALDWMGKCGCG